MSDSIRAFEKEMRELSWETMKAGRSILKNYKLTDLQFDILVTLYFNKDVNTLTDISSKLHLAKSTISSVFDKLEREKYISRKRLAADKRVIKIRLLKKGENMINKVIEKRVEFLQNLSQGIKSSDIDKCVSTMKNLIFKISNTS